MAFMIPGGYTYKSRWGLFLCIYCYRKVERVLAHLLIMELIVYSVSGPLPF
jgi:hypothetical protein